MIVVASNTVSQRYVNGALLTHRHIAPSQAFGGGAIVSTIAREPEARAVIFAESRPWFLFRASLVAYSTVTDLARLRGLSTS